MNISTGNTLLNYMNSAGGTDRNSRMNAIFRADIAARREAIASLLNEKFNVTTANDTAAYKMVAASGKELQDSLKALTSEAEDSIYAKAAESGDNTELCASVKEFAACYNSMVNGINKLGGTIDTVYGTKLESCAEKNKEALAAIGISIEKDGTIALDQDKLSGASAEDIRNAFGTGEGFGNQISSVMKDIIEVVDNAVSIKEALSSRYGSNGSYFANTALSSFFNSEA